MVMTNRLQIDQLAWDHWNLEHIKKHGVSKTEIDEVVQSDYVYKDSYKERFLVTGRTRAGRVQSIAVGGSPGLPGTFYVFSARQASRKERRELEESER
jgi:uncharacterized DUF497 family protein